MSETLYDKYGGAATVGDIVHSFYEKVLDTDSLLHYFQGIDMQRLTRHQTDFLTMIFDGPVEYSSQALRESHRRLRIPKEDFDTITDLLEETLEEADVDDDDIETVMEKILAYEDAIVSA